VFICKTKASAVTQSNVEVHCRQRLSRCLAARTSLVVGQIFFLGSPTTPLANFMRMQFFYCNIFCEVTLYLDPCEKFNCFHIFRVLFLFWAHNALVHKEHVSGSLKFAILPLLLDNILALATRSSLNIRGLCVCACVRASVRLSRILNV